MTELLGNRTARRRNRVRALVAASVITGALVAGTGACTGSGGRRPVATPGERPSAPATASSVQQLYESGRYREVIDGVNDNVRDPRALWFAAQSGVRLGDSERAARLFAQLAMFDGPWQAAADLGLALLRDNAEAIDRARETAAAHPTDPIVQFQLGLAHTRRNDFVAAAQAFDRSTELDPRFAYAYYHGGLAYDRMKRTDLAIARLETFARLAPDAPERPEVTSILQTVKNR